MKNGPTHGGSFIHRWLSRSSNASNSASYGGSDTESNSTHTFSPPPLTDSSSASGSSSEIRTPRDSPVLVPRKQAPSRFAVVRTPRTPPTRYAELPPAQPLRKAAISLPPNSQRPTCTALVIAQPLVKLHHLLSYYPMRRPLVYDISSPPSFIRQSPSQIISRRYPMPPSHMLGPQPTPVSDQDLSQYATTPPVSRMRIVSDIIPWSIPVRGRHEALGNLKSYIRVVDVIDAIYHSLRSGVNEREWKSTPKPYRNLVKKAYFARCVRARAYTLEGYEEKQGVRRVDWFLEKTMFLGLTIQPPDREGGRGQDKNSGEDESIWAMMVDTR